MKKKLITSIRISLSTLILVSLAVVGIAIDKPHIAMADDEVTVYATVNASVDDCWVYTPSATWYLDLTSPSQQVGYYTTANERQGGGIIFRNLNIPQGVAISSATINFTASASDSGTEVKSAFYVENTVSPDVFTDIDNYKVRRGIDGEAGNLVAGNVTWDDLPSWTDNNTYTSPDISALIQQLISSANWTANVSDICIFWDDHADRTAHSNNKNRVYASADYVIDGRPKPTLTIIYGADTPYVSSISPTFGSSSGGESVTIGGSNFQAGATVTIAGENATDVTVVSVNTITCTTPSSTNYQDQDVVVHQLGVNGTLTDGYFYIKDVDNVTTVVGLDDDISGNLRTPWMRKSFTSDNRVWLFFENSNDSAYFTSRNGSSTVWETPTLLQTNTSSYEFAVAYDGTYCHIVRSPKGADQHMYYIRGDPQSDGTISWTTDWQDILTPEPGCWFTDPCIAVTGDSYPVIASGNNDGTGALIQISSTNNGTWTLADNFSFTGYAGQGFCVGLTGNKAMGFSYNGSPGLIYSTLYNGSSFEAIVQASQYEKDGADYDKVTAVSVGDDIHMAYSYRPVSLTYHIMYAYYEYGVGWSVNNTIIQDGTDYHPNTTPAICANGANVVCGWLHSDYVLLKNLIDADTGEWDTDYTVAANETDNDGFWNPRDFQGIGISGNQTFHFYYELENGDGSEFYMREVSYIAEELEGESSPTVTTSAASDITCNSATGNGNITSIGSANVTYRGFQYGIGAFTDNVSESGNWGTGVYDLSITGLDDDTEYQYRAFARNSVGISYGSSVNFTTTASSDPTFTTVAASIITNTTARLNGTIASLDCEQADDTYWQWGFASGNYTNGYIDSTNRNNGSVYYNVSNLTANTTYYFIGAARLLGGSWQFGSELSFTTTNTTSTTPDEEEDEEETTTGVSLSSDYFFFLILGLFTVVAFWQKSMVLFLISGVITMYVGMVWVDDYLLLSIMITGLGTYEVILGVLEALTAGGPSRGLSQFKGIYDSIRGAFRK